MDLNRCLPVGRQRGEELDSSPVELLATRIHFVEEEPIAYGPGVRATIVEIATEG
jgi:hypothetical protein